MPSSRISSQVTVSRGTAAILEDVLLDPAVGTRLCPVVRETKSRTTILIVEDSPDEREFVGWAFEECRNQIDLRFVEDGQEALDYLHRFGRYQNPEGAPRPSLILLDLYMPKVGGFEIIREVRHDADLCRIPIIVFTRSNHDPDILRAYELGANSYLTKPDSLEGYQSLIRVLEAYWLRKVELPPPDAPGS
jgi:two-component system response regulator